MSLLLGYAMGLLSTLMFNIAPVLQKRGMDQVVAASMSGEKIKTTTYMKNKTWFTGFMLGNIGGLPFFVGLAILGLSVIQPLSAFGYILLAVVASKTLGERPGKEAIAGIAMLCTMPVLLSVSGVSNVQADMGDPAVQIPFIVACTILALTCVTLGIVDKRVVKNPSTSSMTWAIISGVGFAAGGLLIQSIFGILVAGGLDLFRDLGQALVLLGAGNVFVIVAIIVGVASGVANMVAFIAQQVAIKRGKATSAYPVSQSVNILLSSIGGIFIFGQVVANPVLYILALAFAIAGTTLLGKYQATVIAR